MSKSQTAPTGPTPNKTKKKRKGPFKVQRYGGWLLYFWHGMRFGAWARLLAHGRFDVTLNCIPNILTVTLWAPLNSALYYISEALYRRRANALLTGNAKPTLNSVDQDACQNVKPTTRRK